MKTLNLQITGDCDLNCKFCSDLFKNQKGSKVSEILEVIDKLPKKTIEKIEITGGEPLLYPNLLELLKEIKLRGFSIGISTNGVLLENSKDILEYVDEVTLPIDSCTSDKSEKMGRNKFQLHKTLNNIVLLRNVKPEIKIKVSTVLNKENINEIKNLAGIIELSSVDEWELHQFLPHGEGRYNIREFILGDDEFQGAIDYLETTNIANILTPISVHDKLENGWLITPSLNLVKLVYEKSISYGSALKLESKTFDLIFNQKQYCIIK